MATKEILCQNNKWRKSEQLQTCNGDDDCSWFLHDDETTKELNAKARDNNCYNSEVLFLLYAQEKYYNNESGGYFEGSL